MKKFSLFIIIVLIATSGYTQNYQRSLLEDSLVKIPYKHLVAGNQAFIQLKGYKGQAGILQKQINEKNAALQFYERGYKKYMASDSINTILLKNKDVEINTLDIMYKQEMRARKLQKGKTIGLGVSLPVAIILSFLAGFYIAK